MRISRTRTVLLTIGCLAVVLPCSQSQAQGIMISGVGAVNRSFGSVAAAAPIDAAGAIYYNPATMTGLRSSSTELGLEPLWSDTSLASRLGNFSGATDDRSGVTIAPTAALVRKDPEDCLAYGIGFFSAAGFRTDYPADPGNPILSPQPPAGRGLGRVNSSADIFQLHLPVAYQLTEQWSVGAAPILDIARVEANPFVFAPPNGNGAYAPGSGSDYRYGGGFQLGLFYEQPDGVSLGAAWKSPQWMENFPVDTTDEHGLPRRVSLDMNLPMVVSIGASYRGVPQWVFGADVRYFDYGDTELLNDEGYRPDGAVAGLGWDSIFSYSGGVQYSPTDRLALRLGYTYHPSPVPDRNAIFNVASPLIIEHVLGLGATYALAADTELSISWVHGFEHSVEGPIITPAGIAPGSSVESTTSANAVGIAATFYY